MKERRFFTAEKKPKAISHKNVYLTLIAEELISYSKAHYAYEYLTYPVRLAKNYLQFENKYYDFLETCLQNFKGMHLSEFDDDYQTELIKLCQSETDETINDTISFIQENIAGREESLCLEFAPSSTSDKNLNKLLNKKSNTDTENKENDIKQIDILEIPKSILTRFRGKVRNIGKAGLMDEALDHAVSRATLSDEKIYRYKKLKHSISEVYDDLVLSKTTEEPKKSILAKDNSEIINKAVNSYEIIGNRKYLINKRSYYKALGKHFREKLKKDREKYDN